MNTSPSSSFGLYESFRILIPGFYFTSLCAMFYLVFAMRYYAPSFDPLFIIVLFLFIVLVSGLSMYAKETTKRRRAFMENQPSAFLQNLARKYTAAQIYNDAEAKQLYFYILNNFIPTAFHNKIFFFGTVYHIMIHVRRTSFWFTILSITCIALQTAFGLPLAEQQGAIIFCILVCFIYLLFVRNNKADRKMQENYQDQIFWLQMNEEFIKGLIQKSIPAQKGIE